MPDQRDLSGAVTAEHKTYTLDNLELVDGETPSIME